MSNFIAILFLALLALANLSCQPNLSDGELKLVVAPSTANALPIPVNSCKSGGAGTPSVATPSYEFTRFKFSWFGSKDFTIGYIQVILRSGFLQGGVDSSCILSAADLDATLGTTSRVIPAGDSAERNIACSIRCGGLKIDPKVTNAYMTGVVRMVGVQTDTDGNSFPVVSEAPVAVQFTKIQ